jgi:hypothetical protein
MVDLVAAKTAVDYVDSNHLEPVIKLWLPERLVQ